MIISEKQVVKLIAIAHFYIVALKDLRVPVNEIAEIIDFLNVIQNQQSDKLIEVKDDIKD